MAQLMTRNGLDRIQAAAWCGRLTKHAVQEGTIRLWEHRGLLPRQSPGYRKPATYRLEHLVQLRLLAEMRRVGLSHRSMRRALQELSRQLPDLVRLRVASIALTSAGHVASTSKSQVGTFRDCKLSAGGLIGWSVTFDLRRFVRDARTALQEAT